MDRRTSLRLLATATLAPSIVHASDADTDKHEPRVSSEKASFFTEHEMETVRVLADWIIPADDRSGSASDAGVPEYIDFVMTDQPELQLGIRGGLAWLDAHARRRHGGVFVESTPGQQSGILDEIAYPSSHEPEVSQGVAFFNQFRDLVAGGFWSSKMGVDDLQYVGNVYVAEWEGCSKAVMDALGLTYDG